MAKKQKSVDAVVVGVDPEVPPVDAVVVGDNRRLLGKRLGTFALAILLLFFAVMGFVQSSRNGELLKRAAQDRSLLIQSNNKQVTYIQQLQQAIREQNALLKKAGFKVVQVPDAPTGLFVPNPNSPPPRTDTPSTQPKPTPAPAPSPTTKPKPGPSPTPQSPIDKTTSTVCSLTGICVSFGTFHIFAI